MRRRLLAWTQTLLLTGELAVAEPRTLRYRILHIAGRLIRSARRTWLRLPEHWPWTGDLLHAYRRLATITSVPPAATPHARITRVDTRAIETSRTGHLRPSHERSGLVAAVEAPGGADVPKRETTPERCDRRLVMRPSRPLAR